VARVFNFGAGPAMLPEPVLRQVAGELLDWHGTGMSVMEMSHRGKEFMGIYAQAEADLRELLAIPKNYKVLFLQGGAAGQGVAGQGAGIAAPEPASPARKRKAQNDDGQAELF